MNDTTRDFVMAHMYHGGAKRHLLSDREWGFVYLNGDGFGLITESFARRNCWDWSHVRDSSPAGIKRMAKAIVAMRRSRVAVKNLRRQHTLYLSRKKV